MSNQRSEMADYLARMAFLLDVYKDELPQPLRWEALNCAREMYKCAQALMGDDVGKTCQRDEDEDWDVETLQ